METSQAGARVLVVGHVTHDRTATGTVPGGSALYTAKLYRALGAEVHVVSAVGDDFAHPEALADIEHSVARGGRTTTFTNRYGEDGVRTQHIEAVAAELSPAQVPAAWRDADVVHLAPVFGEIELARWIEALRAWRDLGAAARRGPTVAIGIQGWLRARAPRAPAERAGLATGGGPATGEPPPAGDRVVAADWCPAPEALRAVDIGFVSEEDLRGQGGMLARLTAALPVVIVTDGVHGARALGRPGRELVRAGIYPVREVDATGAGDTFAAALLWARAGGAALSAAVGVGTAAASLVVERAPIADVDVASEITRRAAAVPVWESPVQESPVRESPVRESDERR